jgi:hypothetical protein
MRATSPGNRAAAPAATLMAYTRPAGDVTATGRRPGSIRVEVQPIPEAILNDPPRLLALRVAMERQIGSQVGNLPEERYRNQVRPQLARALGAAGLSPVEVDGILRSVDYHRSL